MKNPITFHELSWRLEDRLKRPLPGPAAHELMRAEFTGKVKPLFNNEDPPRLGSVLILLYEEDGEIRFPLIKRPEYTGAHSGQISLPGGKAEANETIIETALREGEEEIGINRKEIYVVGQLSNFFVLPSNFLVTPVIATIDRVPSFVPDAFEVAKILTGTVSDLVREDAVYKKEIVVGDRFNAMVPHFEIEGEMVWGATAMMLSEFRVLLREMV